MCNYKIDLLTDSRFIEIKIIKRQKGSSLLKELCKNSTDVFLLCFTSRQLVSNLHYLQINVEGYQFKIVAFCIFLYSTIIPICETSFLWLL